MRRISKFLSVVLAVTFAYGIGYMAARSKYCPVKKTKASKQDKPTKALSEHSPTSQKPKTSTNTPNRAKE
ncbi:TPA: hypothetical protein DDZ86_00625 [Candidatus Dependentiae bacterium]|nr:MAG: hypothetical protein UW09_C0002G0003 [candidate division TM6 bacterium GW2011_GWF2_43_87]HBL98128.1 hypothetical protein [Candidatus Dependentiae bacterium]